MATSPRRTSSSRAETFSSAPGVLPTATRGGRLEGLPAEDPARLAGELGFDPALLADGRVIYSRWEYSDKALWRIQSLWTTRQDGTGTRVFWGNQSVWPDHLAEARPIPGSERVMFAGVAHHDWFAGSIGILDPSKGRNFPHGLTKVTADVTWPISGTVTKATA